MKPKTMERDFLLIATLILFSMCFTKVVGIGGDGNCTAVYQNFTKCILNEYQKGLDNSNANKSDSLGLYLCGKGMLSTCTESMVKNLSSCFKVSDSFRLWGNTKAMKKFVEILCENNGQRLIEIRSNNGHDCLRNAYGEKIKSKCKDLPVLFNYFNGKDEDCNKKRNASSCVVDALSTECPSKNVSYVMKDLLGQYIAASPCGGAGIIEISALALVLGLLLSLLQKYIS